MIVQAVALLDDLDKEINIYAMRVKVCDTRALFYVCAVLTSIAGMVRLAFPRNGENHRRQHRVREGHQAHEYVHL